MMCGGFVGRVKRLLEGHDQVTTASVNLATETALVRVAMQPAASMDQEHLSAHASDLMAVGTALAQVCAPLNAGRQNEDKNRLEY
jgi:Cu2+-exporting ATPase